MAEVSFPSDGTPHTPDPQVTQHFVGGSSHLSNSYIEKRADAHLTRAPGSPPPQTRPSDAINGGTSNG
jgi:hypothetical protein